MSTSTKISKKDFVLKAIEKLRTERSTGIHVVYSGFNQAFEAYYGEPSRTTTDQLIAEGVIESIPAKGGPMIYKKGEAPTSEKRTQKLVDTIVS